MGSLNTRDQARGIDLYLSYTTTCINFGEAVHCSLLAYTASTAPRELMVVEGASSQTNLTVSWRAPEFPNGVISQYMVSSRIMLY